MSDIILYGHYDTVEEATAKAECFLRPLTHSSSTNPQATLAESIITAQQDSVDAKWVVAQACRLLVGLHEAVIREQQGLVKSEIAYSTSLFTSVYGLVDLVILEGVYPSLSVGIVSVPQRRARSHLFEKSNLHSPMAKDLRIMEDVIVGTFEPLLADTNRGIQPLMKGRLLLDLLAALFELAYSPDRPERARQKSCKKLQSYLDSIPLYTLYTSLTALMRPECPSWYKSAIAEMLALLPTRPEGVRSVIEFIAVSHSAALSDAPREPVSVPSQGAKLPFAAFQQASRLLSAIPRSMSEQQYLDAVASQLLSLLDGSGGAELSKLAGFVIGHGFLSKRSLGAPGTPAWMIFVKPLQEAIDPSEKAIKALVPPEITKPLGESAFIETELTLTHAIQRLTSLIGAHRDTALVGRLIRPLLLPLWSIAGFDASAVADPTISELAFSLLQTFLRLSGSVQQLELITSHIMWDGPAYWHLIVDTDGSIAIVPRTSKTASIGIDLNLLARIDRRVDRVCSLIRLSGFDDSVVGSIFFNQLKIWAHNQANIDAEIIEASQNRGAIEDMANAKLVLAMLDCFGDSISAHPENALRLIDKIVQNEESRIVTPFRPSDAEALNYRAIHQVKHVNPDKHLDLSADDMSETLIMSLSLLPLLLGARGRQMITSEFQILQNVRERLLAILAACSHDNLNRAPLQNAIDLIDLRLNRSIESNSAGSARATTQSVASQEILVSAQAQISSDLPPVRASGIQTLIKLIKDVNIYLDLPATALLLLHIVRTDAEDFVIVAAIRAIRLLVTCRNPQITTKLTVEAFRDQEEQASVDGRLRIGEVIINILQSMSEDKRGIETARAVKGIVEGAVEVAGRRGQRKKEDKERKQKRRLELMKRRDEEPSHKTPRILEPASEESEDDAEDMPTTRATKQRELAAMRQIVQGWEGNSLEEDVRIRTSAISIIGEALENYASCMHPPLVNEAVDMALAITILERTTEKAILRRASVLLILSLLRALDCAGENLQELSFNLDATKWQEVEHVLRYAQTMDQDDLVRGHATAALESLEAWRMKQVLGVSDNALKDALTPRFALEGKLRGIEVDIDSSKPTTAVRKIEELD